jgi:hypothetical protein
MEKRPMPRPVEGYIKPNVRPYEDRIAKVVTRAWDAWWKSAAKKTYAYRRVRACAVHELMVREARKEFESDRDVHIINGQETIYLLIKNRVILRLKKGDDRGLGQNNHSQQSLAFVSANADVDALPLGLPDVQRADVTYLLNPLETRIERVLIVGRDGRKKLWGYPIYPREATPVAVLPLRPVAPVRPHDVVRVPSRRDEKKDVS